MRLLLDTHIFICSVIADRRLKRSTRELMVAADGVSMLSPWAVIAERDGVLGRKALSCVFIIPPIFLPP